MFRPERVRPERGSIFGDTYGGVPNPMVAVERGYPTRNHGPIFTYVQPSGRYLRRPVHRAPFMGLGATAPPVISSFCWKNEDCGSGLDCCLLEKGRGMCVHKNTPEECIDLANWYPQACVDNGGTFSHDTGCSKLIFPADPFNRPEYPDSPDILTGDPAEDHYAGGGGGSGGGGGGGGAVSTPPPASSSSSYVLPVAIAVGAVAAALILLS